MSSNKENRTLSFSNFPNMVIDRNYRVVAFNQKAFDDIKYLLSVELKKGNSVFDYINPENHEKTKGFMNEAFNGNFIRDVFSVKHLDGRVLFWEYYYKPVFSGSNKIETVSISGIDVTKFKIKEIELQESEARYKGIVESQYDLIMRLDLEGKYTFANNRFCEVTGKTRDEIIGSNFLDTIHPDDIKRVSEKFGELMTPPYRTTGEVRGMTVDGWRWFQWESVTVNNDKGEPVEVQGVCRDITEYKNAMLKLAESNELLSAIMLSSPAAIIVFDFSGKINYWSKGAEKIFGWNTNEVLHKDNPTIFESERNNFYSRLESLKKGNLLDMKNIQRFRKDGSTVILDVVGVPLRNEKGEIIAALAIYEDVTEKINVEIENFKLSSVMNLSTGAVAILGRNLEIESVNPKFSELTGYSFDELKELKFRDIRPPQMPLSEYYKIESIIKSGVEWKSESLNRSKNGTVYYENILVSPIKDSTGTISNFLLVKEDVSERNKALQELINTRLRLGTIMNSLPNLLIFEFSEGFSFISPNIRDVLGYPREMFLENRDFYRSIIYKEDLVKFGKPYTEWINSDSNDVFSGVLRFIKPGNLTIWIEMFLSKTKSESSVGICGLAVDITESRQAQEKLSWNETMLHAMTESTRYGYYAVDLLNDEILYVNERFCEMWGVLELFNRMTGKNIKNAEVMSICSKSVQDSGHFYLTNSKYSDPANTITFEDEVELASGRTLRRFSSLLKGKEGGYLGRFYLYEDITEKKLYERMANLQNDYKLLVEDAIDSMVITDLKGSIKVANSKFCHLTGFGKNELSAFSYSDLFLMSGGGEVPYNPDDSPEGKTLIGKKILKRKDGSALNVETRSKMLPNKLIQIVISEIEKHTSLESGAGDDGIPNIYVNILTKLRLFRHGENSLSCLNRISLFLKNFEYLSRPGADSVSEEMKQRFFVLTDEFSSSVGPQLDYIVALISNLTADSPNVEFREKIQNLKNNVSTYSETLGKSLSGLYDSIKEGKSSVEFKNVKSEILASVSSIKNGIKKITLLLEDSYVTDAPVSLGKITGKFMEANDNADIALKVSAAEPRIIFNALDFQELMNILLVNSAEAAGPNKKKLKISFKVYSAEGRTIVEYTDNGKGIPAKIKDRVFESGFTTKGRGRGFGLNFAGRVMKKYGGKIMLDSETKAGVKFILEFNPY